MTESTRNGQFTYFYSPSFFYAVFSLVAREFACLLSGPFKTFSLFLFANLNVLLAPYISVFYMAIVVLKLSNVSVQKTKYLQETNFQHFDSPPYFEISEHDHPSPMNDF